MWFTISDKDMLDLRNQISTDRCIPILLTKGFVKAPFKNSDFGRNNLHDFLYNFGRVK